MDAAARQILIVYDSKTLNGSHIPVLGLCSQTILPPYQILFNSSANPSIPLNNIYGMGIDPGKIDSAALTRERGDGRESPACAGERGLIPRTDSRHGRDRSHIHNC
ncbi:MAG: hypothetical protein JRJ09_07335 [Deltaproteobacteria bacterium]|nr:hypothetical protein [Deltaproteobacteria bacterium]